MISSKLKPMAHQAVSLKHDQTHERIFDLSDAGTGKTAVRIWAFAARRRKKGGCALVLAPRTLLRTAWLSDFAKFAPDMKVSVATAANREQAFAIDADAYVTNHDAVKWLAKQKKGFFDKFSELVIDESPAYKHHSSQRSKAVNRIAKHFKRRAALTMTPTSNGICDIWHQALIIDDGKRLGNSFFAFRNTVCQPIQVGRNENAINWVDKPGAEEAVFGLLGDMVVRHRFEDCIDIPATHTYTVPYELPKKLMKTYEDMEMSQLLILAKQSGTTLTAVNAAVVAGKLLQICSGAVYDNDKKYHVLDAERYELILDLIEQRSHSLVFFQWKHQKDQLTALADKRGVTFCVLDGDASDQERIEMVNGYQRGEYKVMFAHPKSAAHGLTLTRGTSTIWAGPTYDLEWWKQGNKRQSRIGQTQKTEVLVVLAKDTIEEKVYDLLTGKNGRMMNLLDMFASMTPRKA